jgi:hypothetical protein
MMTTSAGAVQPKVPDGMSIHSASFHFELIAVQFVASFHSTTTGERHPPFPDMLRIAAIGCWCFLLVHKFTRGWTNRMHPPPR